MTDDADKWVEYEVRKQSLPPLAPDEYEREIERICEELDL
jgi:hypothetical protein